jgi:hypothetical protein
MDLAQSGGRTVKLVVIMRHDLYAHRIKQIENGLAQDLELLSEYESALRLSNDPKEKVKFRSEIDRLKSSIIFRETEMSQYRANVNRVSRSHNVNSLPLNLILGEGREMVLVEGGDFFYGPEQQRLNLETYYIDRYPVTNRDYFLFLKATSRSLPVHWEDGHLPQGKERHPVTNLTYSEAVSYADWAGKRLPSEEEWEKAMRGTDARLWPWGHQFDDTLCHSNWRYELEQRNTAPIGGFSPKGDSPYGVSDVGQVWEWTNSWFEEGWLKVVRGGPWRNLPIPPLIINRSFEDDRSADLSFRCACSLDMIKHIVTR